IGPGGIGGMGEGGGDQAIAVIERVMVQGETQLPKVRFAIYGHGRLTGPLHSRKKQSQERSDDRKYYEEFDESKSTARRSGATVRAHAIHPFCRTGQRKRCVGLPIGHKTGRKDCRHVRSDACDRSIKIVSSAGRSSGLRLLNGLRTPSHSDRIKDAAVVVNCSKAWPITAAAPQRICTAFPFFPALASEEPVETDY